MQQSFAIPLPTSMFLGVAEDCCMLSLLLAVPSCIFGTVSSLHPTSFLMIFIIVSLIFYPGSALIVARGKMMYPYVYVRMHMRTRIVRVREVKRKL